jgi:hypothetical protein
MSLVVKLEKKSLNINFGRGMMGFAETLVASHKVLFEG